MARKNKYPVLYTSKETIFTHRGLGTLKDCIDPEVIEERNGVFELELTYPVGSFFIDNLVKGNIIKCDVSETLADQLFRIYRVGKYHDNKIKIVARHISFDSMYDFIENVTLENASCEYALNQIFRASTFCKDFRGYSNIVNAQNYSMQYTNPLSAIAGKKGSIIDTYGTGAEILRDNKNIHVLNSRGRNNSVLIAYRKNLTGLEAVEDTSNLITRIFPYIKKTVDNTETLITLSEKYVDSPRIFDYEHPFIKEIDFTSYFDSEEEITQAKLKLKAEQYFINNKCDIPKINYKIQFIPLSQTLNYASDYKCLENIDICDTVIVRDSRYNIDTEAKVIKVRRNPITLKIIAMELGEPKTSLGNLLGNSGDSTQGPPGPPGPQGPPGADGNIGDFPNSLPNVPVLSAESIGLASIELTWTYEGKVYYEYELYASKTKDFSPNSFDLIFKGQASTFLHQVQPNETWYYRVRAVNTHGFSTEFSTQVRAETFKISDAANWFESAAIGDAVIGKLSLDRGWVGQLKGNWIDAKQLSVTDGNGKRTLDIDSFGNVNLDVNILKIKSSDVATKTELTTTANGINETIKGVDGRVTEVSKGLDGFKVETINGGGGNLIKNGHKTNYFTVNQAVLTSPYMLDDDIKTTIKGQAITISFECQGSMTNSTHASMFGIELNITYSDNTTDWLNCSTSNNTQSSTLTGGTYRKWVNNSLTVQNKIIKEVRVYCFARYFNGEIGIKNACIQVGKTNGAYMLHQSSVVGGITTIDVNGVTVDSTNSDCITNINANGNKVTRKSDGKVLFEVNGGNLNMEGTLSTGTTGQRIEVSGSDYKVFNGSTTNAFFGYRNFENSYLVPKFYMGAYGFDMNTHNYFGITPYKGNADNPQGSTAAYVDLSYRSITHKDWSNIKMYSDGNVRLAPIQNFEITTNFLNGSYAGSEERRLAMFTTSSLDDYNSNLQIGVVANHSNSNGLVLADRYRDACWPGSGGSNNGSSWRTAVRIHTDSNNNKFFRPLNGNGDIELGSASFPWKKVTATSTYSSEGIVYNPVSTFSLEDNSNKSIIDRVKFVEPKTRALSTNEDITMDVTDILDTGLVEVSEEGQAFINNTAFTKLLLKESKRLKAENEMLIEKNNELMARLEVTQKALDELLLNIMEV